MAANILDKSFKYVPSSHTDIRKTFARIKRQLSKHKSQTQQKSQTRQVGAEQVGAEQQRKLPRLVYP